MVRGDLWLGETCGQIRDGQIWLPISPGQPGDILLGNQSENLGCPWAIVFSGMKMESYSNITKCQSWATKTEEYGCRVDNWV